MGAAIRPTIVRAAEDRVRRSDAKPGSSLKEYFRKSHKIRCIKGNYLNIWCEYLTI
jgi:hypothetical protein